MGHSVSGESDRTSREIERIRADIDRLKSDLRMLGGDVRGAVGGGVEQARDFASDSARSAIRHLRQSGEFVERQVAEHPLISISVALVAGVAAGALLMRRNSNCD